MTAKLQRDLIDLILEEYPVTGPWGIGMKASATGFVHLDLIVGPLDLYPTDVPSITLSMCNNHPYEITGEERVNYVRKWREIEDFVQRFDYQTPFDYIGIHPQEHDFTRNLPNAFHVVGGFFEYLEVFERLLGEKETRLGGIGWTEKQATRPVTRELIDPLTKMTSAFYRGLYVGDAPPCPGGERESRW